MKISDAIIELCLIFLIIFTPLAYGAIESWGIAVFEVTAAIMAFIWLLKMLKNRTFEFIKTPLTLFIFLFIGYVFFQYQSLVFGLWSSVYRNATKTELFKIISYALIFFVTLNTIKTKQQIMRILLVVIPMGFFMSIFYLIRYFGVKAPRGIINSDHFSAYLGMIIPLGLGVFFARDAQYARRDTQYAIRFLLFFCVIIMSVALFFTMSRGGMFSFIAALLFMAVLTSQRKSFKRKGWVLSAVIILIIFTIAWLGATPVVERVLSIKVEISSRYFGGRFPIWQGTLNLIKDYPIFGTGLGTFNDIFPKYQPLEIISRHYTHAHSDILQVLSETGIIGFLLTAVCGILFFAQGFKQFNSRHNPWVIGMCIGVFGSLTSIFIHSFTDFNLHIPANAILLLIILALFIRILNYKHDGIFSLRNTQYSLRNTKFILYPATVLLAGIFIIVCIKPAIADYYFRQATVNKPQLTNDKEQELIFAIRYTLIAMKLDPLNAAYHYEAGKLYAKQVSSNQSPFIMENHLDNAHSAYKQAVKLNPTNSQYRQSLAWSYGQLLSVSKLSDEDYNQRAIEEFEKSIFYNPNNPYRYRSYALWLFSNPTKENIENGVKDYKKAVELEPKLIEEALKEYSKYQNDYEKLFEILPETQDNDYAAFRLLEKEKGLKFAIDFANKYLKTYVYNAKIHFTIADASFYSKDLSWDFTEEHYNIAFKNDPDNAYYRYWYAVHLTYVKKLKEAKKQFYNVIKMDPKYAQKVENFQVEHGLSLND